MRRTFRFISETSLHVPSIRIPSAHELLFNHISELAAYRSQRCDACDTPGDALLEDGTLLSNLPTPLGILHVGVSISPYIFSHRVRRRSGGVPVPPMCIFTFCVTKVCTWELLYVKVREI